MYRFFLLVQASFILVVLPVLPFNNSNLSDIEDQSLKFTGFENSEVNRLGNSRFFDDFENGPDVWNNGGEYNTSYYYYGSSDIIEGPPSPHSGSKILRMRTTNSGGGQLSDWHAQSNNNRYNIGTPTQNSDFIIRFYLKLEKKIGFNVPAGDWGFFNLAQNKGVGPNRNSPLHAVMINVRGGANSGGDNFLSLSYFGGQWGSPPNTSFTPLVEKNIPYNKWVEVIIRTKISDGNGIVQVWQDGEKIYDLRNQRTWRNDGGMNRFDVSVNNYGRYTRAMNLDGTWDGESYLDVFIDDYGVYELNPNWDYDLDQAINNICLNPTDLNTTQLGTTSATLNWAEVHGSTGYKVEYKLNTSSTWIVATPSINSTSYTLSDLDQNSTYQWRISTVCEEGISTASESQFTTAITCSSPTNLSTTGTTLSSAELNWTGVGGASGYDLEFRMSGSENWVLLGTNISGNSFSLTGLSSETAYEWRIRSNCGNLSGVSEYILTSFSTTLQTCEDLYEPNDTKATAKLIGTASINARIGSSTDQDWFELRIGNGKSTNVRVSLSNLPSNTFLYLYDSKGALLASSEQDGASGQSVIFNSGANRVSYFIQIKGDGNSSSNDCYTLLAETNTKAFSDQLVCNPPTGLNTSGIDLNSATISWLSVSNDINYRVEFKLSSSTDWTVAQTQTNSTSLTLTGLTEGKSYDWRVKTNCLASSSTYVQSSFNTMSSSCLDVYEDNNSRSLAKNIPVGTGINASISYSNDVDWFSFISGKGKSSNLRITLDGLPVNLDLYLYNSAGNQIASSQNSGVASEQIILNNAQTNTTYFVKIVGATAADFSGMCYRLLVENSNKVYSMAFTEIAEQSIDQQENLLFDVMGENGTVKFYPNPTRDKIYIEFYSPISHPATIELIDSSGKEVKSINIEVTKGQNQIELDLNREVPGVYFLRLKSIQVWHNKRIIIK
jgi:hypothetical protein